MSTRPIFQRFHLFLLAFLALGLFADATLAARLETDRSEIEVGDVVTIRVAKKPLIAIITNWKASGALELISSDKDTARVRAVQPGTGTVSMRMNGNPNSIELTVKAPAAPALSSSPPPAASVPMPVQAMPAQPGLRLGKTDFLPGETITVEFSAPLPGPPTPGSASSPPPSRTATSARTTTTTSPTSTWKGAPPAP